MPKCLIPGAALRAQDGFSSNMPGEWSMFERGDEVVQISGGVPMTVISIAIDRRAGQRLVLCEQTDAFGRLRSWRIRAPCAR